MHNTVVVLYGKLSEHPDDDELDVLEEIDTVSKALTELGYYPHALEFDLNLEKVSEALKRINPRFVFNLVETIENRGELHHIAPALLEFLKIPYTGVSSEHLMLTTNKILTKEILRANGINTADWFGLNQLHELDVNKQYIVKPLKEDGSLGIDEDSVFSPSNQGMIEKLKTLNKSDFFIEEYIDGREFNISVLGGKEQPEVLPIAEIKFTGYPDEKPRVVGFTAKWKEDSFEYKNTPRTFDIDFIKPSFTDEMNSICVKCWNAFNSKGYIRVDFRIDKQGTPYVIEINGNPCISSTGGFYAAIQQAGYNFNTAVSRIITDAGIS
jgi:D-alanine-D-alanine ligase